MKCRLCGDLMKVDTSILLTSNPPKYKAICPTCGEIGYVEAIPQPKTKTYYLQNKSNDFIAEIELTKIDDGFIEGRCYMGDFLERDFVCEFYFKDHECTHWYFKGQNEFIVDGYYHICGHHHLNQHIADQCFVWKVASMYLKDYNTEFADLILKDYKIVTTLVD